MRAIIIGIAWVFVFPAAAFAAASDWRPLFVVWAVALILTAIVAWNNE